MGFKDLMLLPAAVKRAIKSFLLQVFSPSSENQDDFWKPYARGNTCQEKLGSSLKGAGIKIQTHDWIINSLFIHWIWRDNLDELLDG